LDVLGLGRGSKLTWREISKRILLLRKQHNTDDPDHGKTLEEMRRNTERMQQINVVNDDLNDLRRKHNDKLVDVIV
jgi:hypothetical protein